MAEQDQQTVTRAEIANAVVIAVSGLLISYASYEGTLWSGEEELSLSRANVLYTQAARTWDRANTAKAANVELFSHWVDATLHKDQEVADYYAGHAPPNIREAFAAWLALDPLRNSSAPFSPMGMPQYTPTEPNEAQSLEAQGDSTFQDGRRAKRVSESYAQAETILSTALFFAGIGQVFRARATQYALLGLAAFATGLGILRLLTLPMLTLFGTAG
jgi:hypothetical protein